MWNLRTRVQTEGPFTCLFSFARFSHHLLVPSTFDFYFALYFLQQFFLRRINNRLFVCFDVNGGCVVYVNKKVFTNASIWHGNFVLFSSQSDVRNREKISVATANFGKLLRRWQVRYRWLCIIELWMSNIVFDKWSFCFTYGSQFIQNTLSLFFVLLDYFYIPKNYTFIFSMELLQCNIYQVTKRRVIKFCKIFLFLHFKKFHS